MERVMRHPFRIMAVVLLVLIGIEIGMILSLQDLSDEVEAARLDYLRAYARNLELRQELAALGYKEAALGYEEEGYER